MKRLFSFAAAVLLSTFIVPATYAQTAELMRGTQIHLTLLNGLSTSVARNGDPFTASVSQPVYLGAQLILPAGALVHGTVTDVEGPKRFALIRGGAYMSLRFNSIEVESRIFPARMSLIAIYKDQALGGKQRKDIKTIEGVAIEEKRDIKRDVLDGVIGTGGGSLVGVVFSHVVRGFGIGLIGSAAYITARRGKNVEIPAQSGMLVRVENTVWVPVSRPGTFSGGGGSR